MKTWLDKLSAAFNAPGNNGATAARTTRVDPSIPSLPQSTSSSGEKLPKDGTASFSFTTPPVSAAAKRTIASSHNTSVDAAAKKRVQEANHKDAVVMFNEFEGGCKLLFDHSAVVQAEAEAFVNNIQAKYGQRNVALELPLALHAAKTMLTQLGDACMQTSSSVQTVNSQLAWCQSLCTASVSRGASTAARRATNSDERATQLLQDRQRMSADLIAQRTDAQRKHSLTVQSIHQHWQPLLHQSPTNSVNAPTSAANSVNAPTSAANSVNATTSATANSVNAPTSATAASLTSLSAKSSDVRDRNAT